MSSRAGSPAKWSGELFSQNFSGGRRVERLWSPWRSEYVTTAGTDDGCIFCTHLASDDVGGGSVLHRGEDAFVLMNAFPYNTGHLMIAPNRHVAELDELSAAERHAVMDATTSSIELLREALNPHGFNVGMNLGVVAGAGIPGHLHMHVVPRWGGDTNFMPVVGDTKVLPEMLAETEAKLRPLFARMVSIEPRRD